jgi:hypothetical protein
VNRVKLESNKIILTRREHKVAIEIEIEIYPLQKGVLKDIISPVGCNRPVV